MWGSSGNNVCQLHDSALEISKHIQSMDEESVNSFHGMLRKNSIGVESIKDATSIITLINSFEGTNRAEKGHMESILGILESNNAVLNSADQIIEFFEMAKQIAKNNVSSDSVDGSDDESTSSSLSNEVMEKKPAQGKKISSRKSQQPPPPPPPPPPTFKPSTQLNRLHITNQRDQQKQKQKQKQQHKETISNVGSIKRDESYRSQASDTTDSVIAMADRLSNASVIDEPSVIEGPDDKDYWRGTRGRNKETTRKGHGRAYKQIRSDWKDDIHREKADRSVPSPWVYKKSSANSDVCDDKSGATRRRSDRRRKEFNDLRTRKQKHEERKQSSNQKQSSCLTSKPQTDERKGTVDRFLKKDARLLKKKTQTSMVSNTTDSTAQSTPSLLGRQINIVGSNRIERRGGNASVASNSSKKSSRSQASRASSRKSSFSRKSRLSRASSLCDDESLEHGSVEDKPTPIFVLPAPPQDEISVCESSLSCRSGRARRQPSESGSSITSSRSRAKQQLPQSTIEDKSSSWTKMKARFKKKKTKPRA